MRSCTVTLPQNFSNFNFFADFPKRGAEKLRWAGDGGPLLCVNKHEKTGARSAAKTRFVVFYVVAHVFFWYLLMRGLGTS